MSPAILIVDDEDEILEFLEENLQEKYTVFKANNPAAALSILEKELIQLVISDVIMPKMDGFQLCKAIKSNIEFSHIPVILLTAKNTVQAKVEGLELGADAFDLVGSGRPDLTTGVRRQQGARDGADLR